MDNFEKTCDVVVKYFSKADILSTIADELESKLADLRQCPFWRVIKFHKINREMNNLFYLFDYIYEKY